MPGTKELTSEGFNARHLQFYIGAPRILEFEEGFSVVVTHDTDCVTARKEIPKTRGKSGVEKTGRLLPEGTAGHILV